MTTTADPGRITRLLPADPTGRTRILNAQATLRDLHAKQQAGRFLAPHEVARRSNAARILDRFNQTGRAF